MESKSRSVLIPHDGSELSGRIVDVAEAVLPAGSSVELVHIDISERDDTPNDDAGEIDAAAKTMQERGVVVARHTEPAPDAAAALLALIEQHSPELVLMATHGRSGSGRFVRGSVAERVMRECSSPLLMLNPAADGSLPMNRVLVPLDASERSFDVIPPLLDMLAGSNARITLLFVDFDDPTDTPKQRSDRRQQREADVASWFEKPASQIAAAGLDMEIRVEHGIAADVILRLANEPGYDLLAMTTHGRSGLARWAFGSVADRVLSACQKPILLKRVT